MEKQPLMLRTSCINLTTSLALAQDLHCGRPGRRRTRIRECRILIEGYQPAFDKGQAHPVGKPPLDLIR
jgi:hypothetical protein